MEDQSSPALRVGKFNVSRQNAVEIVRRYIAEPNPLDRRKAHAFDVYDAYRAQDRFAPLDQADLLAPVLLDVPNLSVSAYRWLTGQLAPLNRALDRIGTEASLSDPDPDLGPLADLFSLLDDTSRDGIRMTILSKILHRKRPRMIPLWDTHSLTCYSRGEACPVPEQRGGTRQEYALDVTRAMHADLRAGKPLWEEVARLSTGRELTELRALDIVAWTLGKHPELATISV
jgi:hypothetical protein